MESSLNALILASTCQYAAVRKHLMDISDPHGSHFGLITTVVTNHILLNMHTQNLGKDFFTGNEQKAELTQTLAKLNSSALWWLFKCKIHL